MNHLIVCREYAPYPYSAGGIGTYVDHMSRLLATHGETVHVIAQRWPGAPLAYESRLAGRLVIHRVSLDEPLPSRPTSDAAILRALLDSAVPSQAFMWQAALLAESLVEKAQLDTIEGQDYEAPLYFLLVRRALGLGPVRRVPVIVHLHSPTEFVFRENGWNVSGANYLAMKRLEDYSIHAADAVVCPSQFLARIAESHYEPSIASIQVIPYPMGETPFSVRQDATWRRGTICYVGRLEPRKGVMEWIDAASAIASRDDSARFVFIGGDTSVTGQGDRSMREALQARIPVRLQGRFDFLGALPQRELITHLEGARLAVVPSRWENFPYSCIEAMSTGLPVLVSPSGGMAEMVEDGRTGWIAEGSDAKSLEQALERALSSPPQLLAEMGAAAAASIRVLCGNQRIVERQLDFRRQVVERGARSVETISERPVSDPESAVLQFAERSRPNEPGMSSRAPAQGERTMTALEILRAGPRQQLAVVRRALRNPTHVAHWIRWHVRRAMDRLRPGR